MADLIELCPDVNIQQNLIPRVLVLKMAAKFDLILKKKKIVSGRKQSHASIFDT